jgi:hypothetical protein
MKEMKEIPDFENIITNIKVIPKILNKEHALQILLENVEDYQGVSFLTKYNLETYNYVYSFKFNRNQHDICFNFKVEGENFDHFEISLKDGLKHIYLEDFILVLCALDFANEAKINIYFKTIPQKFTLSFDTILLKSELRAKLLLCPFSIQKSYIYSDGNISFKN